MCPAHSPSSHRIARTAPRPVVITTTPVRHGRSSSCGAGSAPTRTSVTVASAAIRPVHTACTGRSSQGTARYHSSWAAHAEASSAAP
ncbi:Uncharacterised protein [Mycobacteroides abscessus]|nr:Uncharacterised protein [Mycobacteroides abscessus]